MLEKKTGGERLLERLSLYPLTFSPEHPANVALEHVERMVHALLLDDLPLPLLDAPREHLAHAEASVLVLHEDAVTVFEFDPVEREQKRLLMFCTC